LGGLAIIGNLLQRWPVALWRDWRFAFLVAIWLTFSGLTLPLVWLLHRRFGRPDAGESWRSFGTLARQSAWVGSWGTINAWLQMNRTLNWAMALLMGVVLALLEALLLTRERLEDGE